MKLIKNRLFLAASCILIAVVCMVLYSSQNSDTHITAYKLKADAAKGTLISENMITATDIGGYGMKDVVTDKNEIINKFAGVNLAKDQLIFKGNVSDSQKDIQKGFEKLDGKKLAYAINIDNSADSVANKLIGGDIVSVYIVDNSGKSEIPAELNYVEVFSATTKKGIENTENTTEDSVDTVTLILSAEQAKVLNFHVYNSKIHLALVYRGDEDNKKMFLEKQENALIK